MRLHSVWTVALGATLLLTTSASGQDKGAEIKYKFRKGDVLKYDVTSSLDVSQVGTHPNFLMNGNDKPLSWAVNGSFENKVVEVNEADGAAQLERTVKSITSTGHVQDEKFKLSWSEEKDKAKPDENKLASLMDRLVASMIANPVKYSVDTEGKSTFQFPDLGRLVMRRGMMTWPIRPSEMSWTTTEEIAVPVLHDKIKLEFKNTVTQDATRTGYKARIITATPSLKSAEKTPGFGYDNLTFAVSGQAKAEFDMTNGRLAKLELDLTIRFSGKGQVGDGGEGDIKGVATYKETQVYKD
ncbi:MAG TPA: hypothetical protein VFC90_04740 [Planctomycetota bacterium]|nr:hypothetical protein [Planctomycetota bacterium]